VFARAAHDEAILGHDSSVADAEQSEQAFVSVADGHRTTPASTAASRYAQVEMGNVARVIVVLAMAWSMAACVGPGASSPIDSQTGVPATGLPTPTAPGSSFEPGHPKPSIEIPPPID
jgi:hypothetical protein